MTSAYELLDLKPGAFLAAPDFSVGRYIGRNNNGLNCYQFENLFDQCATNLARDNRNGKDTTLELELQNLLKDLRTNADVILLRSREMVLLEKPRVQNKDFLLSAGLLNNFRKWQQGNPVIIFNVSKAAGASARLPEIRADGEDAVVNLCGDTSLPDAPTFFPSKSSAPIPSHR